MAFLRAFGCSLPVRVVDNAEMASMVGTQADLIAQQSGIEERRFAGAEDSVASLGIAAANDCLQSAGMAAGDIGMVIVSSASVEQRFPGAASTIAAAIGAAGKPAIDLPMASAGSLFALSMAAQFAPRYGNVLVVASEVMSRCVGLDNVHRDTAILFGDGAGACLVSAESGFAEIADFLVATDGNFAELLRLDFDGPLFMNGIGVIRQAGTKLPQVIKELLERNQVKPDQVAAFLLHQANLKLIQRVAQAVGAPLERFFTNIQKYGNTSSASMLIAAAEWHRAQTQPLAGPLVFAVFGAGLNWGSLLARPVA